MADDSSDEGDEDDEDDDGEEAPDAVPIQQPPPPVRLFLLFFLLPPSLHTFFFWLILDENINSMRVKWTFQEIGICHMRILDGVATANQLTGLLAKLCLAVTQK